MEQSKMFGGDQETKWYVRHIQVVSTLPKKLLPF